MVISDAEKKVLLERLEKARIAKQAKAAEAKKAKEAPAPAPAPAPVPEPAPAPAPVVVEEKPPASEPIDIPVVPDLVKASKKPTKKVVLPDSDDSDSDEEIVMPKKKSRGKAVAKPKFAKIVLYREPKNQHAFQSLVESLNEDEEEDEEVSPPPPPIVKGPRVLQKVGTAPKRGAPSSLTLEDIKAAEMRKLALEIFG